MSPLVRRLALVAFAALLLGTFFAGAVVGWTWSTNSRATSLVVFALFYGCQWWQSRALRQLRMAQRGE